MADMEVAFGHQGPSRGSNTPNLLELDTDEAHPDMEQHLPHIEPSPTVISVTPQSRVHVLPRRFIGPIPEHIATSKKAQERRKLLHRLRQDRLRQLLSVPSESLQEPDSGPSSHVQLRDTVERAKHTFRLRRRDFLDGIHEQDVLVDDSDDSGSSATDTGTGTASRRTKRRSKPARKTKADKERRKERRQAVKKVSVNDRWIGNSFNIGREFETPPANGDANSTADDLRALQDTPENFEWKEGHELPVTPEEVRRAEEPAFSELNVSSGLEFEDYRANPGQTGDTRKDLSAVRAIPTRPKLTKPHHSESLSFSGTGSVRSSGQDTFVTAHSHSYTDSDAGSTFTFDASKADDTSHASGQAMSREESGTSTAQHQSPASSSTPLLVVQPEDGGQHASSSSALSRPKVQKNGSFPERLKSAIRPDSRQKGPELETHPIADRSKKVQFDPLEPDTPSRDARNVSTTLPTTANTTSIVEGSSEFRESNGGGVESSTVVDEDEFTPGGVVMRDRVLVKIGKHREESITYFDEDTQRRIPCYRFSPMEEFIVGLTMTSIDFYNDWAFTLEERWKKGKRLRYSIPLARPTYLSVFNDRDLSLAIICPWTSVIRATMRNIEHQPDYYRTSLLHRLRDSRTAEHLGMERHGTAVLIVYFKERSRALDWYYYIGSQLDVALPPVLDIHVPVLQVSVRIPVPSENPSTMINRDRVISYIWDAIRRNNSATQLIRSLGEAPDIELVWKSPNATLDWIAYSTTVTGKRREWALLASFAEAQVGKRKGHLQIRDATHHINRVKLEDGTILEEPPGIEGYLTRHEPSRAQLLYVSVNDGVVFISSATGAVPPPIPKAVGSTPGAVFPKVLKTFTAVQHRRMAKFMVKSAGCVDLRDVKSIQLKTALALSSTHGSQHSAGHVSLRSVPLMSTTSPVSRQPSQAAPPTSSARTAATLSSNRQIATARTGTRQEREFEIELLTGERLAFEAHTPDNAAEWVDCLRVLVDYWSLRHRVDARERMNAVDKHKSDAAFLGLPIDLTTERLLNSIWNWCVIDGCRPITLSGLLFIKKGAYSKFKSKYLVLTGGNLVTFKRKGANMRPRQKVFSLFGSYAYSGMFAQDELRESVQEAVFNPSARLYQDGLQTTDGAEDTTFCICITWPKGKKSPWSHSHITKDAVKKFQPPLLLTKPSQKLLICRARSRLERDRWVWAINAEKERFARSHVQEEEVLRKTGDLPKHSTLTSLRSKGSRVGA